MSELEKGIRAPKIGGTLPHDHYIIAVHSIAISLKRIADFLDNVKSEHERAKRP